MPIVAPLDLHTNLSDDMVAGVNAFVGYKEYPHVDTPETGARALQILVASIQHGTRLVMAHTRLPLIVPNQAMVTTWLSPLKIAIDRARDRARAGRAGRDRPRRLPLRRRAIRRGGDDRGN